MNSKVQLGGRGGAAPVRKPRGYKGLISFVLIAGGLAACDADTPPPKQFMVVRTTVVREAEYAPSITLTGEIRPRVQNEAAFRVGGRIVAREVEIGAHVAAGDVLARLDPAEQHTALAAAQAAADAAEAELRQASLAFERQASLLDRGYTTRREHDRAEEAARMAQAALDAAEAEAAAARDQLSHTVLRAAAPGIVTARHVEVGQVVQAAQPVFTLAEDGQRDAVFSVQETVLAEPPAERAIAVSLVADPRVAAVGAVREVAPVLSRTTGAVLVKVGLAAGSDAMPLGAAVSGVARFSPRHGVILSWRALASQGGKPAVWVVDPVSNTVTPKLVTVAEYDTERVIVSEGLAPGEIVVTAGAQLLRPGQVVVRAKGVEL
jgi:RND family efflux transporter MFP subunit